MVHVGDIVKWERSRKPLGTVVHIFHHKDQRYAIVENKYGRLSVVVDYDALVIITPKNQGA